MAEKDTAGKSRKPKRRKTEKFSLYPLKFEDALRIGLNTKPQRKTK